jgi:Glycosyltransferase
MRCCEIVPSLEARHGGPSRSVLALSEALASLGSQVSLLSTQRHPPASPPSTALEARIFRRDSPQAFCPSAGLRRHLFNHAFDVIHHHSLWLRTLHYAHRRARTLRAPLVISPRGMMSPWAWQHHRARKQLARRLLHPGALEGAHGWHATSPEEADEIRALGFQQPICVAPNGVSIPSDDERIASAAHWHDLCPDTAQRPTALFYSRLHRKKRVLELIDLWLAQARGDWLLLIVGVPEEYTPAQLIAHAEHRSGADRVRVFDGTGSPPPYAAASLFILPSHNENFGLVIAEAMAHGLPVLVTDSTPWSSVNHHQAGWCVPWEQFPSTLTRALAEPSEQLAQRGAAAREHVRQDFPWRKSAATLLEFYRELHARAAR